MTMVKIHISVVAIIFALTVAGCAAGPDFHGGAPANVKEYTAEPLPTKTLSAPTQVGAAQNFINDGDD